MIDRVPPERVRDRVVDILHVLHTRVVTSNAAHGVAPYGIAASKTQVFTHISRRLHGPLISLAWLYAMLAFTRIHTDSQRFTVFQWDFSMVTNVWTMVSGRCAWQQSRRSHIEGARSSQMPEHQSVRCEHDPAAGTAGTIPDPRRSSPPHP